MGASPLSANTRQTSIPDDPSEKDEFGPHSRIASAIASLVTGTSDRGSWIALTGPWGSGKSSVIRQLQMLLEGNHSRGEEPVDVFVFDAWIHQGDPLRRCFLERFIQFAHKPETQWERKWKRRLDVITGRRETTRAKQQKPASLLAVALAISLLVCLPIGGTLMGKYDAKTEFWTNPFALLALSFYSIPAFFGLWALFTGGLRNLAASVIRDLHQDTETRTVRTREASSIDFKDLFGRIASEILKDYRRRLVIVIDNLDRIDAENAVSMWTTMRAFFDFEGDEWNRRVWLIVPFDRSALTRLWKDGEKQEEQVRSGSDLADSFLEKTFQIVFHLSPPVLTRLRTYFAEQMHKIFDDAEVQAHFDGIYRIYSLLGPPTPSPRQVKTFLNKLRAQALVGTAPGEDAVPLPFLAVQVLKMDALAKDAGVLIREDFLTAEAVNVLEQSAPGQDWRQQVAAAHFGVQPSDALQMILFDRLARAFQSGDFDALREVRGQPYFWTAFRGHADLQHREWIRNPTVLANAIRFVSQTEPEDAAGLWMDLARKAILADWSPMDSRRLEAASALIHHAASPAGAEKMAQHVLRSVSLAGGMPAAQWAQLLDQVLGSFSDYVPDNFDVAMDDPDAFVAAQMEWVRHDSPNQAWRRVRLNRGADVFSSYIAAVKTLKDYGEFSVLRERVAAGSEVGYQALNDRLLQTPDLDLGAKLDFLMPPATVPEAEMGPAQLQAIHDFARSLHTPRTTAASVVLTRDPAHRKSLSVAAELLDETVDVLRSWKREEVLFDPGWYESNSALMQDLWESLLKRQPQMPIPLGALAALYPSVKQASPTVADALLDGVARRPNVVEALV